MSSVAPSAVETRGLSKRYGAVWALRDCSVSVPRGSVTALIGPNGAGKTTLLRILAALSTPSEGTVTVLGRAPGQDVEFLNSIGYLAQEPALYKRLTADEHLSLGRRLNHNWDSVGAVQRVREQRIPNDRPVATFSGGQRARLALTIALAKRPQLLLLDEPVAALDPLARHEFLRALAEAVAEGDLSVIMSSHLLHDLERVCDHLILLASSRTQLSGDIEEILSTHRMLSGPRRTLAGLESGFTIVKATQTVRQTRLLVKFDNPLVDPSWAIGEVGLEDVVLAYMSVEDGLEAGPLVAVSDVR